MQDIKLQFLQVVLCFLLCDSPDLLKVNSLEDSLAPLPGVVTLRMALQNAQSGDVIRFDETLDGRTIELSIVGEEHSILRAEVMEFTNNTSHLIGFFDRDYGASALYAQKDITLDASALQNGITLQWTGGKAIPARVLAVYGDLTLINVNITGGTNTSRDISEANSGQPWTLSRGCGVAVWGKATLINSKIYNNHCTGDFGESRDRGAFGGGVYANLVDIDSSIISGNSVIGAGAAGGGIYSVGGPGLVNAVSRIQRSSVTGNSVKGIFTYGGGVYSDGGSIGSRNLLEIVNSTIARNTAVPVPLPQYLGFLFNIGYWRGGGVYMSNGYLRILSSTIVENEVHGYPRTDDLGKPNLAGGVAATIGNAHAAEEMVIGQSIITGNTVTQLGENTSLPATYDHDIFSGSLIHFKSYGYNLIGAIDFSQILVPVGERNWWSLSRKHYPMPGDKDGVLLQEVINLDSTIVTSAEILSVGVQPQTSTVLYYHPKGSALDRIPPAYTFSHNYNDYGLIENGKDDFLEILLERIEFQYQATGFAASFTADFENYLATVDTDLDAEGLQPFTSDTGNPILTLDDTAWFGPAVSWPSEPENFAFIEFYHRLDNALHNLAVPVSGQHLLGEVEWNQLFPAGTLHENPDITIYHRKEIINGALQLTDQRYEPRPKELFGDSGAIEAP